MQSYFATNDQVIHKPVELKEIIWLLCAVLVSLVILIVSRSIIPANLFGSLSTNLYPAEITAILAFYLIARVRSIAMVLGGLIVLPTIQAALIYGWINRLDWLFDIL